MSRRSINVALHTEDVVRILEFPEQLFNAQWYKGLSALAPLCVKGIQVPSLSVVLVSDKRIRELNKQYRGLNRVTDVLSFAYIERGALESGEIYLCVAQALRQRVRFRTTKTQEVARLFFHGMLHIFNYDHDTPGKRKEMRALEDCLMKSAHAQHLW
ncbi:MAG: rRNA maturation RNase YbeY [Candidatus Uhrbacteria bacterium]|nr:rRNA maturation RNase YbeY [Candidatus Uhrbacteria bacterium]